jgi:Ca2+-binding RTX toxin-like protein
LGNGYNTVTGSSGADTIVVGTGGNSITGGAGADVITFGAHVAGVMDGIVMGIAGETWTGALITSGATALTGVDKVTGLKAGDTIDLAALSPTVTGAAGTTIAAASTTTVSLVKGSFDATTNIWTTSATGTDTLVVYDADAAVGGLGLEAIVLVGTVATGTVANGVLTLA